MYVIAITKNIEIIQTHPDLSRKGILILKRPNNSLSLYDREVYSLQLSILFGLHMIICNMIILLYHLNWCYIDSPVNSYT